MDRKTVITFLVVSSIAIVVIFLLNSHGNKSINGEMPVDFVYAIDRFDISLNSGNKEGTLKYFDILLKTQDMVLRRARKLFNSGERSENLIRYLLINDPYFLKKYGNAREKETATKIIEVLNFEGWHNR